MNILRPEDAGDVQEQLALWCTRQIGLPRMFDHYRTMGVFDGEKLIAVMVYHNWQPECGVIEISGAATDKRWLTRPALYEMFAYPFDRLEYQLVVMRVSQNNQMANGRGLQRMLKSYGFNEYRIPRLRGRDEDEIIFTLTDDQWRSKLERRA